VRGPWPQAAQHSGHAGSTEYVSNRWSDAGQAHAGTDGTVHRDQKGPAGGVRPHTRQPVAVRFHAGGLVERRRVVGLPRHETCHDLVDGHTDRSGQFVGGRCPSQPLGQLLRGVLDRQVAFL
jgi:hypothetical protein